MPAQAKATEKKPIADDAKGPQKPAPELRAVSPDQMADVADARMTRGERPEKVAKETADAASATARVAHTDAQAHIEHVIHRLVIDQGQLIDKERDEATDKLARTRRDEQLAAQRIEAQLSKAQTIAKKAEISPESAELDATLTDFIEETNTLPITDDMIIREPSPEMRAKMDQALNNQIRREAGERRDREEAVRTAREEDAAVGRMVRAIAAEDMALKAAAREEQKRMAELAKAERDASARAGILSFSTEEINAMSNAEATQALKSFYEATTNEIGVAIDKMFDLNFSPKKALLEIRKANDSYADVADHVESLAAEDAAKAQEAAEDVYVAKGVFGKLIDKLRGRGPKTVGYSEAKSRRLEEKGAARMAQDEIRQERDAFRDKQALEDLDSFNLPASEPLLGRELRPGEEKEWLKAEPVTAESTAREAEQFYDQLSKKDKKILAAFNENTTSPGEVKENVKNYLESGKKLSPELRAYLIRAGWMTDSVEPGAERWTELNNIPDEITAGKEVFLTKLTADHKVAGEIHGIALRQIKIGEPMNLVFDEGGQGYRHLTTEVTRIISDNQTFTIFTKSGSQYEFDPAKTVELKTAIMEAPVASAPRPAEEEPGITSDLRIGQVKDYSEPEDRPEDVIHEQTGDQVADMENWNAIPNEAKPAVAPAPETSTIKKSEEEEAEEEEPAAQSAEAKVIPIKKPDLHATKESIQKAWQDQDPFKRGAEIQDKYAWYATYDGLPEEDDLRKAADELRREWAKLDAKWHNTKVIKVDKAGEVVDYPDGEQKTLQTGEAMRQVAEEQKQNRLATEAEEAKAA